MLIDLFTFIFLLAQYTCFKRQSYILKDAIAYADFQPGITAHIKCSYSPIKTNFSPKSFRLEAF